MSSGFRFGCVFWVGLVILVSGSTTEVAELESLDNNLDELSLLDLGRSGGTSALQMELEGMVDPTTGKSLFMANASDSGVSVPPKAASEEDIASLSGEKIAGDVDISEQTGPRKYHSIPFLSFKESGSEHAGESLEQCQQTCSDDKKCKSFSYRTSKKSCFVSTSRMQYDLEFEFLIKVTPDMGGEPELKDVGPLKYTAEAIEKSSAHPGLTSTMCQEKCATDLKCNSVAYRARDQLCLSSALEIGYHDDSKYFEKEGASSEIEQRAGAYGKPSKASAVQHSSPDSNSELREKVLAKAKLTPEQARYVARAERNPGDAKQQALENAILGVNVELKSKNLQKRMAAAQKAKRIRNKALAKKAAEAMFKDVEKKALKESDSKLKELMEGSTKSEEKNAEAASKGSQRAKEKGEKEAERLKHSSACELVQKSQEANDLKLNQLSTESEDFCQQAADAKKAAAQKKQELRDATAAVTKWTGQKSQATTKLVYISEKAAIKAAEALIDTTGKQLATVAAALDESATKINKLKDQQPDLDAKAGSAASEKVRAKGALSAARLAVQAATTSSETTLAKAAQSGALSDLAKAESEDIAADQASKKVAIALGAAQKASFSQEAEKTSLEDKLAQAKLALKNAQDEHFQAESAAKLSLSVASHQLPAAIEEKKSLELKLEQTSTTGSKTTTKCTQSQNAVKWQGDKLKVSNDKQKVCLSERNEKAALKTKAEEEFVAMKAAFELKMEQRKEADFIKMMAAAETESKTAVSMEAKANAGSKVADLAAEKMEAQQKVSQLIPRVQGTEVDEAKATAKEIALKTNEQRALDAQHADEAQEHKDAHVVKETAPGNPSNVIKVAKELLETLKEKIGMAEIAAGEVDTTSQDDAVIAGTVPKAVVAPTKKTNPSKPSNGGPISNVPKEALKQAETALASGDQEQAMKAISTAEEEIEGPVNGTFVQPDKTKPDDISIETKLVIAGVKKDAKQSMLNAAAAASKSALDAELIQARAAEQKENGIKSHMKEMQHALKLMEHKEALQAAQSKGIVGQWSFAGDAVDAEGNYGSATLHSATWEKDDTYGEYLSFNGEASEANLGDLKFTTGTLSLWVRVNKPVKQRLFGPGMESESVTTESVEDAVTKSVAEAVEKSLNSAGPTELLQVSESAGEPSGEVTINADGSISISSQGATQDDGPRSIPLSAQGVVVAGKWVSLVFAFSQGKSVTLYVNGALQHTVDCENDFDGHPLILGRGLEGGIKNVKFWTRVLLRPEVLHLNKPASEADQTVFRAYSAEGQYELSKTKAEALSARLKATQAEMAAAENKVKSEEKEKNAQEVRDKNEMKAAKARREDLAAKDKANQEAAVEQQAEIESKERSNKSKEAADKDDQKSKETSQKDARKEKMEKDEEKDQEEARKLTEQRLLQKKARDEHLAELKKQAAAQKTQEQHEKKARTVELTKKKTELANAKKQAEIKRLAGIAANKERVDKANVVTANERKEKDDIQGVQVQQEQARAAAIAVAQVVVPQ